MTTAPASERPDGWSSATRPVDIHQHLLPAPLAEALRRRDRPPLLAGSTLHRTTAPPAILDDDHFDVDKRRARTRDDGCDAALVSLSTPIGIEYLPPDEAGPLLDLYHDAVADLPEFFAGWAAACVGELDPADLDAQLTRGFVGLQLPATELLTPQAVGRVGPLLSVLERHDKPLLVHPGPPHDHVGEVPSWWTPTVLFVQQLHAAWHAWEVAGAAMFPELRVCFVALAGLAPLHEDRRRLRGANGCRTSGNVFYETSSYGMRTVEAVQPWLGRTTLVYGSDRPYAEPSLSPVALDTSHRTCLANTRRLLLGDHETR